MSESARIAQLEAELAALKKQPNPPANTMDELDDDLIMSIDESQFTSSPPPPAAPPASGPIPRDPKLAASLLRFFGYDEFREGQEEVVNAVLAQRDVAVFWATGRGKSLCYQLPALHTGKTAVIVSPLVRFGMTMRWDETPAPPLPWRFILCHFVRGAFYSQP